MAGTPVSSARSVTGVPAAKISLAVPPLLTTFQPSSCRPSASSMIPDLSYTESSAVGTFGQYATPGIARFKPLQGVRCAWAEFHPYMEANVDLSKLKTSDWLKIGGAVGFLIFGFFHWTTVEGPDGFGGDSGFNVFHFFFTGTIPWILVIATGVITLLLAMGTMKPGNVPWPLIMLVATGLAAILLLIRLLFNPIDGK